MQEELLKRLKSFAWRLGCTVAVAGLSWTMNNLGLLELPPWSVALVGLALGEATKWVNNHTDLFGGSLK